MRGISKDPHIIKRTVGLSYIETISKRQPSLSLYRWIKQNPENHISEIYDNKTSAALLNQIRNKHRKWN